MDSVKNMTTAACRRATYSLPIGKLKTLAGLIDEWKEAGCQTQSPPIYFRYVGKPRCLPPTNPLDAGLDIWSTLKMDNGSVLLTWPPPDCSLTITDVAPEYEDRLPPAHPCSDVRFTLRLYARSRAFLKAGLAPQGYYGEDGAIDRFDVPSGLDRIMFPAESVCCRFNIIDMRLFDDFMQGDFSSLRSLLQLVATYEPSSRYPRAASGLVGGSYLEDVNTGERMIAEGCPLTFHCVGGGRGPAEKKVIQPSEFGTAVIAVPLKAGMAAAGVIDASYRLPFVVLSKEPVWITMKEYMIMEWLDLNEEKGKVKRCPKLRKQAKKYPSKYKSRASAALSRLHFFLDFTWAPLSVAFASRPCAAQPKCPAAKIGCAWPNFTPRKIFSWPWTPGPSPAGPGFPVSRSIPKASPSRRLTWRR